VRTLKSQLFWNGSIVDEQKVQIKNPSTLFEKVSFYHAYRDFNKEADVLSKKALRDHNQRGEIIYTEWEDNKQGPSRRLKVF
jgi:hypothetical protein